MVRRVNIRDFIWCAGIKEYAWIYTTGFCTIDDNGDEWRVVSDFWVVHGGEQW